MTFNHDPAVFTPQSASEVVPLIISMFRPASVLDVGCGIGTWLSEFERSGVSDYLGIDGSYVNREQLYIPESRFLPVDLEKPFDLQRKFGLVVSLEVAEHLPESSARGFVRSLVSHGDIILFSAAVPGQEGESHLNEQWPSYWQQLFAEQGFRFYDTIRPLIWNNEKVKWWYRQNVFVVARPSAVFHDSPEREILPCIHPAMHISRMEGSENYIRQVFKGHAGLKSSLSIFLKAISYLWKKA